MNIQKQFYILIIALMPAYAHLNGMAPNNAGVPMELLQQAADILQGSFQRSAQFDEHYRQAAANGAITFMNLARQGDNEALLLNLLRLSPDAREKLTWDIIHFVNQEEDLKEKYMVCTSIAFPVGLYGSFNYPTYSGILASWTPFITGFYKSISLMVRVDRDRQISSKINRMVLELRVFERTSERLANTAEGSEVESTTEEVVVPQRRRRSDNSIGDRSGATDLQRMRFLSTALADELTSQPIHEQSTDARDEEDRGNADSSSRGDDIV